MIGQNREGAMKETLKFTFEEIDFIIETTHFWPAVEAKVDGPPELCHPYEAAEIDYDIKAITTYDDSGELYSTATGEQLDTPSSINECDLTAEVLEKYNESFEP